jgi:hypothetical protein
MGAIFDSRKVLHGLPVVGQKIQYTRKTRSWFTNVEADQDKLVLGEWYTVRKTELNSSSTYVWLQEFPNIFEDDPKDGRDQPFFNMGSFTYVRPPIDFDALIGLGARECLTLRYAYPFLGIYVNGQRAAEGDPEIDLEYDIKDPHMRVIKAGWHDPIRK